MIGKAEQAGLQQGREGLRRAGGAHLRVRRAMDELQELHGKLHVGEASPAELGIVPAG